MGVPDELQDAEGEGREGADDSLEWLNQLASNLDDGADAAAREFDAAAAGLGETSEGDIPEWLKAELNAGSPAQDSVPEWLRQELAAQEIGADETSGDEPFDPDAALVADLAADQGAADADEDILAAVSADEPEKDESEEDLSWLESIAAGAGLVLEEPPTMSWEDEELPADEGEASPLDEELAWLADLADEDEDETTGAEPAEEEPILELGEEIELSLLEDDLEGAFDVPEDPDEAMAWLERLAAQQGAAAEELTLFAHDEEALPAHDLEEAPESQIMASAGDLDDLELPADDNEALAWLAELAGESLALDQIETEAEAEGTEAEMVGEAPLAHGGVEEWLEEVAPDEAEEPLWGEPLLRGTAAGSHPADEGDAERWLAEAPDLAEDIWALPAEEARLFEQEELAAVGDEAAMAPHASSDVAADTSLEMLEPEEGAEGEALLSDDLIEVEADALPMPEQQAEVEAQAAPTADLSGAESDQPAESDEPVETSVQGPLELDDLVDAAELDEALPDWLPLEEGATGMGETAEWLKTVEGWDAEPLPPTGADPGEDWSLMSAEEMDEISQPILEVTVDELEDAEEIDATKGDALGELDPSQLAAARAALQSGDYREASVAYDALLKSGDGLPFLIAELESATAANAEQPLLHRLLGDAYVQNGQLQKALEVYRTALDQL